MSPVRPIRVLLVDDEPNFCAVSKGFLEESKDIEVEIAYSASKAKAALGHGHFDAIVCDYQMPDEDGIQFLKWLRLKGLRIPFIIFTCRGMEEVVIEALNNGADSYLQKGGESGTKYAELECRIRASVQQHRREEALWESEMRFDQLAVLSATVTWESDVDGLFTYVSGVSEVVWGYRPDELVGQMHFYDLVVEAEREDIRSKALEMLKHKKRFVGLEHEVQTKDGRQVWNSTSGIPLLNEDGSLLGYQGSDTDITERKRAEQALQRQSTRLAFLNDIISAANRADDLTQLLNDALAGALRLLDFDAGGIYLVDRSARTANVVCSKNLSPEFLAGTQTLSIDEKPYDTLFIKNEPIITDDIAQISPDLANIFGFRSIASIPLSSKGVAIGALNVASTRRHMISEDEKQALISICRELGNSIERMVAEREAKKAAEDLEALFHAIDDMVFVLDMQGRILAVNEAVQKRLSYTSEELVGIDVLLLHVPERRDEALQIVQGMIAGTASSCPVPLLAKDGTRIEVETKVTRGRWNGQEVLFGVSRDITERKQAEEALRNASIKLGILNSITRHDINNQVLVLTGFLELCKLREKDPRLLEYLDKMRHAANNVQRQITFTKEYQDIGVKAPTWVSPGRQSTEAFAMLHPLGMELEDDTHGMELMADPLAEKVPYNLIDNSTRHGERVTRIRLSTEQRGDAMLIVYEDNGVGISDEDKKRLFEKGFGKNTGFGLFLTREILAITGITITETGKAGEGVRFEMLVPPGAWRLPPPR